jgi:hypothetical protein
MWLRAAAAAAEEEEEASEYIEAIALGVENSTKLPYSTTHHAPQLEILVIHRSSGLYRHAREGLLHQK